MTYYDCDNDDDGGGDGGGGGSGTRLFGLYFAPTH